MIRCLRPLGRVLGVALCVWFVTIAQAANVPHTFQLDTKDWQQKPKKISVAGEFNGWNKDATPMKNDGKGVYKVILQLPAGTTVHYKFVADGERWIQDPKADPSLEADDGNGGKNSGVKIVASGDAKSSAAKPQAVEDKAGEHTFVLNTSGWEQKPSKVNIAGSFNGWSKDATELKDSGNGVWKATVPVPNGIATYKFVIDGDRWITDPDGDKSLEVDDTFGGKNSGVMVGPDPRKLGPAKENDIVAKAVQHDPKSTEDLAVVDDHTFRVRVRTLQNDVKSADVMLVDGSDKQTVPMEKIASDIWGDVYAAAVEAKQTPVKYTIALHDGSATVDVGTSIQARKAGLDTSAASPISVEMKPAFTTPDWAKHAVWYQIFPERFRNGDPSNDPGDKPDERLVRWTSDWWKDQPGENPRGPDNFYKGVGNVWKRRYGGDIQGIQQELPYLKSLGINAIYLNPIFEAESMHKYDTSDYRHVDNHFGVREQLPLPGETDDPSTWKWSKSDKVFLAFLEEAHKQGFKVIIDGVFNHVGKAHPFFQDVLKNGRNSKYADWFVLTDDTPGAVKYKSWDGDGALPIFKKDDKLGLVHGPREHVLAVIKRWLAPDGDPSKGVDGVRLDVATDIPHPFWVDFRKTVKETKPDAYISGEIWDWAQPWLRGNEFDAVMNYQFAMAGYDFFVQQQKAITPTQFSQRLARLVYTYPLQIADVQMNLWDSHDTDRFASMFMNPDIAYDGANRLQDSGPNYKKDKPGELERAKMRQAVAFQMTFVGAPMIYYGDECGMWGPDDPSDRMPMIWRDLGAYDDPQMTFDADLFKHYQHDIALRIKLPALTGVAYESLLADDSKGVIAFRRGDAASPIIVVINRSNASQAVEVPAKSDKPLIDWLDDASTDLKTADGQAPLLQAKKNAKTLRADGKLKLTLPPYGTAVLAAE